MPFVDSHCHLNFPELQAALPELLENMRDNGVDQALCISVNLEDFPQVLQLAETSPNLYASVGVHPDYENVQEPDVDHLVRLAKHPRVIAIGETGLDYFRLKGDLSWQRERFRTHIRAAKASNKPLIVHTREASEDTLTLLEDEGASEVSGVMHCFTESWAIAEAALDLGFYISFSGIVTFKNAVQVKEVAQRVPLDRMLIETDAPYLAPVPHRGKLNQPAYVRHVAEEIARLRGLTVDEIGERTTENFRRLFALE